MANGQAAIETLIARAQGKATEICWAVDLTSGPAGLLIALLLGTGDPVAYVTGRTVNRMSGAFGGEGKSDAKDAKIIAEEKPTMTGERVLHHDQLMLVAGPSVGDRAEND